MLFLLSFCCSVLSCLFFTQVQNLYKYRPIYLYTYSTDSYLSLF